MITSFKFLLLIITLSSYIEKAVLNNTKSKYTYTDERAQFPKPGIKFNKNKEYYLGYKNLKLVGKLKKKNSFISNPNKPLIDCENWTFQDKNLSGLLKKMKKVKPEVWNSLCYNYPCYYEGNVSNGIEKYKIIINAASFVRLTNKNESIYFINKEKSDFFLTPCNCCEDD